MRSHNCGEISENDVHKHVALCGWVHKHRDLGGLYFIDLRDKYGITQLNLTHYKDDLEKVKKCSLESVIRVEGIVQFRPDSAKNKKMNTGQIEIQVEAVEVMSICNIDEIPFLPFGSTDATEDLRLRYRYLDLRTTFLQNILEMRSRGTFRIRETLMEEGFIEIETPLLFRSTPEGARDYIIPSRVTLGSVYALPQSPQILKQLLMIGGTDKYFQICRCFRDEDLRADRQPEFSQVDIEASFIDALDIKKLVEKVIKNFFEISSDFKIPMMTYNKAMELYGSDKPDLRFGLKHIIATDLFKDSEFDLFNQIISENGFIKSIFLSSKEGRLSRKDIEGLSDITEPFDCDRVLFFKVESGKRSGGISKFITDEIQGELEKKNNLLGNSSSVLSEDGIWLFIFHKEEGLVHGAADALRRHLGLKFKLIEDGYSFLWIYDFPLFEWSSSKNRLIAKHHPFTNPKKDQLDKFFNGTEEDHKSLLAEAYDIVCNGYELGGGSLRIYEKSVQDKMFDLLKIAPEEAETQFGFFLNALKFGVPPHGGIALGLDRMMMILAGTDSIRDVIAFPKTTTAADLMSKAPSIPSKIQLKELSLSFQNKKL